MARLIKTQELMAVTIFKRDTNLETYVLGAESLSFKKGSKMTDGVGISII